MKPGLRFHEMYYGGPYVRVDNPDSDLPRRVPGTRVNPEIQQRVEFEGVIDGERFVAPFNDANDLSEILGALDVASEYPHGWDSDERNIYPTIQGLLSEVEDRIASRIERSSSKTKRNWFERAAEVIAEARRNFAAGEYSQGEEAILHAAELLQQGNKANRRKATFLVGSDGVVEPIK